MTHRKVWIGMAALLLLAGCAFTPHRVAVNSTLRLATNEAAKDVKVRVVAKDARPGTPGAHASTVGPSTQWPVDDDVSPSVLGAVEDGLRQLGFTIPEADDTEGAVLQVEMRSLGYSLQSGFWAATLTTECAIKAACGTATPPAYEQLYRGSHAEPLLGLRTESRDARAVEGAVSAALRSLLTDPSLISCLLESANP